MKAPRPSVLGFAFAAAVIDVLARYSGWLPAEGWVVFTGLLMASIATSVLSARQAAVADEDVMRPSYVIDFASLLLLGSPHALFVVAAGEVTHALSVDANLRSPGRVAFRLLASLAAIQAGSAAYSLAGGSVAQFIWPWQIVPVAAALAVCVAVWMTAAGLILPTVTRQAIEADWRRRGRRVLPAYVVGTSLAMALAEAVARNRWDVVLASIVPVYLAGRAYEAHLNRLHEQHRRRQVADSLVEGIAVVDDRGEIFLWSDTLERMLGCSRSQALGRTMAGAVPLLGRSDVGKAIEEVLRTKTPRNVARVWLRSAAGDRTLGVRIIPIDAGATLLWQDITDRTREDLGLKKVEERLALAADAANDGLWSWDLRSHECFFSARWRAMVGLPAQAGTGRSDDWLQRVHPEDIDALKDALDAHLDGRTERLQHEHRLRHEDGSYRSFLCRAAAARTGDTATRIAGSLTERRGGSLDQDASMSPEFLDPLTGLANRTVFVERLGRCLAAAKQRRGGEPFAVLYLDLDRFKVVNDSLGHLVGDELLSAVSRRLESCLRRGDILARLGGDEFAILLKALSDGQQANAVAFRIQEALSTPFSIGGREVFTTVSIGIALGLTEYGTPGEIMRDADTAMYHAKARGKARHELFDADMHARVRDRLGLENDLRHAVGANNFEVHYQPIVALATGTCVGFESLVRWKRNGTPVPPDIFIPLAEELGLIEPLGTWVLQQACRTFSRWQQQFPGRLDFITVNVSSRQLVQQNFLNIVEQAVHDAGLQPCDLRLEITETALMDSPQLAARMLRELRDFGVKIYLDDFGTGYSSLSHLHKLPVDALKIDRSFVKSLTVSDRPAIVESILALARTLNTSVVAEGIETDNQAFELERLGCTHAQGYLFSRPMPESAAEDLLLENQPLGPKRAAAGRGVSPAADVEAFAARSPFVWPDHIPVRLVTAEKRIAEFPRAVGQ